MFHLRYTLPFNLLAVLTSGVIHGSFLSLTVTVLLGMYLALSVTTLVKTVTSKVRIRKSLSKSITINESSITSVACE